MISATIRPTLPDSRAMHVQTSPQAEVPNGPGDVKEPRVTIVQCGCIIHICLS